MSLALLVGCGDSGAGGEQGESSEGSETDGATAEGGSHEAELFGLVTVTRYPADAAGVPEYVDLAAGLRSEPFEGIEDFVSVVHLQTTFAPPAGEEDEIIVGPAATPWSFEPVDSWLLAGEGITLRGLDDAAAGEAIHGCRRKLGSFEQFPVYLTGGVEAPELCQDEAQGYVGAARYELVLFGGELFDDEVAAGELPTPEPFSVSAPDIEAFELPVSRGEALELSWTAAEGLDDELDAAQRFVVRLWDEAGTIVTVVAADDGALSISAEVLAQLEAGPATITFARETLARASSSVGTVDVILREEHWGYLELYG